MDKWWFLLVSISCVCQAGTLFCLFARLSDVLDRLRKCRVSIDTEMLAANAGSTILVTPSAPLTESQMSALKDALSTAGAGSKFLVLDPSLSTEISTGATE